MVQDSTIVSIVYFSVNIVFVLILSCIVYKTGSHETIKSKSFIQDIWWQKKIFGPVLVYFYDTSTDIGVIVSWYFLMQKEKNNDDIDYVSVNMKAFFWTGIALIIFYRLSLFIIIAINNLFAPDDYQWTDLILVIFDLYIFKAVWISFKKAKPTLKENAAKRQRNNQFNNADTSDVKTETQPDTNIELEIKHKMDKNKAVNVKKEKYEHVEPEEQQITLQFVETITESVPQIVLQSVFMIRSANDPILSKENNSDLLIILSIIGSLITISNKYARNDKEHVNKQADSIHFDKSLFPNCISYWYLIRVLWRLCHIMSRFSVFVLIWSVLGGVWLVIWCGLWYILWVLCSFNKDLYLNAPKHLGGQTTSCNVSIFEGFSFMIGVFLNVPQFCHVLKYIESVIGFILIAIFATVEFECKICEKSLNRQFENDQNNIRIVIFFIMGLVSLIMEILLYIVMIVKNIPYVEKRCSIDLYE
eukprot:516356_1